MATWKSAAYDGRYLQLDISESVNVVNNSSTLSWTLTSTGGASTYYTIDTTTVTINGTTVYSKDRTYWDDRVFPAKKGSVSGTITVAHDSNGSKTITVGFSTRVYIYGSQEYGGSMTLTTIDRSSPTVTFSTSNVTANGFKISATSSATADIWQYSTNGGSSWTQFSTTASTSASVTLSSLSPNTSYTVKVRARRQYNQVYGTSGSSTVKTLGGAVVNSVNTVTADNARVTITLNVTVYEPSYINSLAIKSGNTTILTVTGLAWTKGTANRSVTLSSAQRTTLLNWMASLKSFTGTFAVSSFSDSTQIGSTSSKTATVQTTAANSAPTISGFTYADSYTTTKNLTGNDQLFVQDYSTLKVTPGTATAKNGASISNYTASCNGLSACDSHHVNEDVLEATYLTAMRRLVDSAEEVVEVVRDGTELALEPENKAAMERIDEETIQLQEAALALHKAKQRMEIGAVEYASRVKEYSERMKELEAERNELQGTAAKYAEVRMWLDTFIEQTMQSDTLTTVDGTTMKMLVDRIHVRNDGIVVEFKCGVAIEQEYVK